MNKLLCNTSIIVVMLLASFNQFAFAIDSESDVYAFDDFPLEDLLQYPDWFKQSFLDLPDDLDEAALNNKRGIIVYF
ncbi:MAG: hypothetical protein B6D78_03295, partial [gamma proteobacterium symbiont of Ctena orbiculata]